MARPVTLITKLNNYGGEGAYLVLYGADAQGACVGSLWMACRKPKYYSHMTNWCAATGGDPAQLNGITGARVGSGRTLEITVELSDALFEAGYTLHVDAAVEDMRDSPDEMAVPLTTSGAGSPVARLTYNMQGCETMIRALHRWPTLVAIVLLTVLSLSGAALCVFPAAERLSAPQAAAPGNRGRPCPADTGGVSGRRTDQTRAFGPDHRLLVQGRHTRIGHHRPGHRARGCCGRSQPDQTLADQSAPLAVFG